MNHDEHLFAFLGDAVIEVSDVLQLLEGEFNDAILLFNRGQQGQPVAYPFERDRHWVGWQAFNECVERLSGFFTGKGIDGLMPKQNGVIRLVELPQALISFQLNLVIFKIKFTRFEQPGDRNLLGSIRARAGEGDGLTTNAGQSIRNALPMEQKHSTS